MTSRQVRRPRLPAAPAPAPAEPELLDAPDASGPPDPEASGGARQPGPARGHARGPARGGRPGGPGGTIATARERRDRAAGPDPLGPPRRRDARVLSTTLGLAAAAGLAAGALATWTAGALAVVVGALLVRRLDLAVLAAVVLLPLERTATDLGGSLALDSAALQLGALVVVLAAWALDRSGRGGRLDGVTHPRRLEPVLLAVAGVLLVAGVVRPAEGPTGVAQLVVLVLPAVLALALLAALRGRLTARRLAGTHVAVSLVIALSTAVAVAAGTTPSTYDADRVAWWAVGAVPLLLALGAQRHRVLSLVGVALLLGGMVLQVAIGATSPALLLGVGAALLVAGATGQLGVRTLTAVVALALLAVGTVPVLSRGLETGLAGQGVSPAVGVGSPLELAVPLVITLTALVVAWPRWRAEGDVLAGAVCSAVVGTGVTVALAGSTQSLSLWVLAALAGAGAARRAPVPEP